MKQDNKQRQGKIPNINKNIGRGINTNAWEGARLRTESVWLRG